MQELLIDITRLLGRFMANRLPTGVDRVSLAYIEHYQPNARALIRFWGHSWVASKTTSDKLFNWVLAPKHSLFNWRIYYWATCTFYHHLFYRFPKGAFLFNTGHSGLDDENYATALKKLGVKPIFMVHDLIPITHPEYCRANEQNKHDVRIKQMLQLAHGIITNSQCTLDELTLFASNAHLPMPPATVALLAPASLSKIRHARPCFSPYFVMLGTIEPRKNHLFILQIWQRLVEQYGRQAPKLVIIGQRGWECESVVDLLEHSKELIETVIELNHCSDSDMATWLFHAQALLFPSFVEGYGMPLVEALNMNVPVIANDLPVFREIVDGVPDYIDVLDGKAWLAHIMVYTSENSQVRQAQIDRIRQFKSPTWATHFNHVDTWLQQIK